jgi:hypothetical protein
MDSLAVELSNFPVKSESRFAGITHMTRQRQVDLTSWCFPELDAIGLSQRKLKAVLQEISVAIEHEITANGFTLLNHEEGRTTISTYLPLAGPVELADAFEIEEDLERLIMEEITPDSGHDLETRDRVTSLSSWLRQMADRLDTALEQSAVAA